MSWLSKVKGMHFFSYFAVCRSFHCGRGLGLAKARWLNLLNMSISLGVKRNFRSNVQWFLAKCCVLSGWILTFNMLILDLFFFFLASHTQKDISSDPVYSFLYQTFHYSDLISILMMGEQAGWLASSPGCIATARTFYSAKLLFFSRNYTSRPLTPSSLI